MTALHDPTEQRQTHVLLGDLLESASDAMVTTEPDGNITLVNCELEQLFGYARDELIGQPIETLLPRRVHETYRRHRQSFTATKPMRLELFGRRKDGTEFPAAMSLSAMRTQDGQLLVASAIREITPHRQAQEVQFRATFEQAAAGMAHVALDGQWLRVNQRLCEIVGYSREELLQRNFQDITHPEDLDRDLDRVQQLLAGAIDTYTMDKRYIRKGGSAVWIALTVSLVRHEDGSPDYFIAVVQDISARRQAEDQLGLQASQQAFLAEAGLVLSRSLDYEATLSQVARLAVPLLGDWCTVYLRLEAEAGSPAIRRVAAAHVDPAKQPLLDQLGDLVPVNESAPVGVPRVIRSGRPQLVGALQGWELENVARSPEHWRLLQALGSVQSLLTVPLTVAGETLGAMVFAAIHPARPHSADDRALAVELAGRCAQSIYNARLYQARQVAEARIAAEAARAHLLAECSHAFAAANLNTRTLLDVVAQCIGRALGGACIVQLGAGAERASVGVYHPQPGEAEALLAMLEDAPELLGEASSARHRLGAQMAAAPLRVNQELVGSVSVWRDDAGQTPAATDLMLLQELADRASLALEAARRFEQSIAAVRARDDVLAAVSHDLKAPLTAILASAQMVEQQLGRPDGSPERLARSIARIVSTSRRMAHMMDELVDAARLDAGQVLVLHRGSTDIAALVRAIVADEQITAHRHTIRVTGLADLYGMWDAARLRRVLENLIGNAIKYSPDAGEVRVEIARDDSAGCAVVRVIDQGIGIPAADLAHVFERFRRGRNVTEIAGTGLGLSGARQIVEQHGGRLEVASEEGVGSAFTIYLPLMTGSETDPERLSQR